MAPPNARTRPAGNRPGSESDLLAGGIISQNTGLAELTEAAERQFSARLLTAGSVDVARHLVDSVSAEMLDSLVHRFIRDTAAVCVESFIPPTPLAIVETARRDGIDLPPAFRSAPISALHAIAANPPPGVMDGWLVLLIRGQHVRRATQTAAAVIDAAAWRGDIDELASVVSRETDAVLELLKGAGATP